MSKKREYSSMHEIKIARERLRYEVLLCEEKFKRSSNQLISGFSLSMKNLTFNIRNRLLSMAFFRSLSRSNMVYHILNNLRNRFRSTG